MKRIFGLALAGIVTCLLITNFSCKKKAAENAPTNGASFDRKAMLTNIGNNVILPAYQSLQSKEVTFDELVTGFNANPDADKLSKLQDAFKELYKAWEACSSFELGVADQSSLNLNTNTFPADTTKINGYTATGSYNLSAAANNVAKGLPAIDYLLFGSNAASLLSLYTTDSKAANRKQYLSALSADIKTNVTNVVNAWTGSYMTTFANAIGTDVGSSTGLLMNKMDYDFDQLKNNKLGIPLGKQSMGALLPEKTEGFYCGISAQLALLQLQAIQSIYLGKGTAGDGIGFDDYLAQANAKYNGGSLNDTIKNQFNIAISKLQAVADPLSATLTGNTASVNAAYVEVQKLLVLLKTDMPSSLGILITYVDNDGD